MGKKRHVPTYQGTYPAHLVRSTELREAGLQPAQGQLPVALLKYKSKAGSGTCSLYEPEQLVPRQVAS